MCVFVTIVSFVNYPGTISKGSAKCSFAYGQLVKIFKFLQFSLIMTNAVFYHTQATTVNVNLLANPYSLISVLLFAA